MTSKQAHALMYSCPKFSRCNAPVCPAYEAWRSTTQERGEPVCLYLRERAKDGGQARIDVSLPVDLSGVIHAVFNEITQPEVTFRNGHGYIRRRLLDTAKTGSRLEQGKRVRRAYEAA